jgi:hypothetical protein
VSASIETVRAKIIFRPLLVTGIFGQSPDGPVILIDSEMPQSEQAIALWHEALHWLGLDDERQVEAMAVRLAAAVPEIVPVLRSVIEGKVDG